MTRVSVRERYDTYRLQYEMVPFELVKPRSSLNTTRHMIVHTVIYASKWMHSNCISTLSRKMFDLSNRVLTV